MGDNDFPALMPNWGKAKDKATLWRESGSGNRDYFQTGTDIPTLAEGSGGAYAAGTGMEPTGFAYDYVTPQQIAGSPSFDLAPDIDSPAVDRWIQEVRSAPNFRPVKLPSMEEADRLLRELVRNKGVKGV